MNSITALRGIDKKRYLDSLCLTIAPLNIVVRRLLAVEIGGVDGGVVGLIERLRRELEPLPPDTYQCLVKRLTERRWKGIRLSKRDGGYRGEILIISH
jgi:hypothetical protein